MKSFRFLILLFVFAVQGEDLTTNDKTSQSIDKTRARYLVNLAFPNGDSVRAGTVGSGLYDYAKYRGNQNGWWVLNDGVTNGPVAATYGDVGGPGSSTPPPDYFGYRFKFPVSVSRVDFTDYCFSDGGSFSATPTLEYLSELSGEWQAAAADWTPAYDSSFSGGRRIAYAIVPTGLPDRIWGLRLVGNTTPAAGAWDHNGWASVSELKVSGTAAFPKPVDFSRNLAPQGTPVCTGQSWQSGGGHEILDGNFDNEARVWSGGEGLRHVGVEWAEPQDSVNAIGFASTFHADGGWFLDEAGEPLRVEYTRDGSTWLPVEGLEKGRYTADYPLAADLPWSYCGSWLFTFDAVDGIVGLRLAGRAAGSVPELGGEGYLSIREVQVFQERVVPLASLVLGGADLVPDFDTATADYDAGVGYAVDSITATATVSEPDGRIELRINGGSYSEIGSGSESGPLALGVGSNLLEVRTSAANATNSLVYSVSITRRGLPSVSGPSVASLAAAGARLGGEVDGDGGSAVLQRGVVYAPLATNADPALEGEGVSVAAAVLGSGTGEFDVEIADLEEGTRYAFRAFASTGEGTGYSPVRRFTTSTPLRPNVAGEVAVGERILDPGETQVFLLRLGATRFVKLAPSGGAEIVAVLRDGDGVLVATFDGETPFEGRLAPGDYVLELSNPGVAEAAFALALSARPSRPDVAVGTKLASLRGTAAYGPPSSQRVSLISRRLRPVRALAVVANRSVSPVKLRVQATRRNRHFQVVYTGPGGNLTGALVSGSFRTAELAEGSAPVVLAQKVFPNRKALSRRRSGRLVVLRKTFAATVSASSSEEPGIRDAAQIHVKTR